MAKLPSNWRYRALEQLENEDWGNPNDAPTGLVRRCIELAKTPLNRYSIEDLRCMIVQQFGLEYLIPLAIEKLDEDLFIEGDLYEGDLLESVLHVDPKFWHANKHLWIEIDRLIWPRKSQIDSVCNYLDRFYSVE